MAKNKSKKYRDKHIENLSKRTDPNGTDEREIYIVKRFLENNEIKYLEKDIVSCKQDSKVDIQFEECNFQIKRVLWPNSYKPTDRDNALKKKIMDDTVLAPFKTGPLF
jgi:hypothetical protein